MMRNILDQPLPERKDPEKPAIYPQLVRYGITVLLFPTALLRLRSGSLSAWELLRGGGWGSIQFLLTAILLLVIRHQLLRTKKLPKKQSEVILLWLKITVDLIVFVGIIQFIWQWWSK